MSETETSAGEPAPPLAVGAPKRGLTVGVVAVIAAIFVAFPLLVTDPTTTSIAFFALVFMVAASAWNIFSGYSGYLALGHAVFFGSGGYAVAVAARDWHVAGGWPVFALVLFGGLGTIVGPLLGALVLESLQQYLTQTFSSSATYLIAYGVLFLVVILIMPRGVVPGVSALLERRRVKAALNASAERDAKVRGGVAGAAQ